MSRSDVFFFNVKRGEQKELELKVKGEKRGLLRGVVVDECNNYIEDAAVKLFEVCEKKCEHDGKKLILVPITHSFTDEFGQFIFGPLCPDKKYALKVWFNSVCISEEKLEAFPDRDCLEPIDCCKKHRYCECGDVVDITADYAANEDD